MEIRIGGEIEVNNESFLVVDVINYNNRTFAFCSTLNTENKLPTLIEYKIDNDKLKVKFVKDEDLADKLLKIVQKDVENSEKKTKNKTGPKA